MANLQSRKAPVDVVVVGCGAGGAVVAKELGEAGLKVVVLEAGRRFDPAIDYPTDQHDFVKSATKIFFEPPDPRQNLYSAGGEEGFVFTRAKGVGGSTLAYQAQVPRFHESDFRTRSEDSVGEDWPITYKDLEPYYTRVEYELGVSGPAPGDANPYDPPRSKPFPNPAHELSCASRVMQRGAKKLGWVWVQIPLAIPTQPWGGRPPCIRAGVCGYGCRIRAKSSMDVTYVPKAEATGRVEIKPNCMAREITVGPDGKARSVIYFDSEGAEQEISARAIILAGNAVETPRLLLLSTSKHFPNGLANSSGTVGQYFMEHLSSALTGRFEEPLDPWSGPPGGGYTQHFYATNRDHAFARGWQIMINQDWSWPQAVAMNNPGWGSAHKARVKNLIGRSFELSACGEQLPDVRNRVTLSATLKDHRGIPAPHITSEHRENDRNMIPAFTKSLKELFQAAGAREIFEPEDHKPGTSAHYMGGCRMGMNAGTSVVDRWCRTHDVSNLFVADGSVFVTGAGANPSLTIMALANRTADGMIASFKRGEL
ncbi:putative glucose-methanol-choline oxidoreductase [Nitrospira sp. KM1]|uniref:GMC family oxidoreductase n=1 Tax=Nitrospira sp. KM1 TaxID=1936990 RepID=UPI0013A7A22A|nr:GMC family oxidoreductase [Nitrospira sp. KM1]BCA54130.1 putative glucose-methanol-choline oxidoreductase [Nitrospira sp. KM1]